MSNKRMKQATPNIRTIDHADHTDIERLFYVYSPDGKGEYETKAIWAVVWCGLKQEKQAMTYATSKTTITTREYLQALSDKGYTVVPQTVKIDDVLSLYAQIDALKAEVKNLDEGAKLMHSLATGGEQSVLSRLDNGVDAVDAQRWQNEGSKVINLNGYKATATASWRERHLNES